MVLNSFQNPCMLRVGHHQYFQLGCTDSLALSIIFHAWVYRKSCLRDTPRTLEPAKHLAVCLQALSIWSNVFPHLCALLSTVQTGATSNFLLHCCLPFQTQLHQGPSGTSRQPYREELV